MNTSGYEDHLMVTLIEDPWSDVSTEAGPYNNDTGGCQDSTDYKNVFIHGSVGIAILIIMIFGFLERRTQKYLSCCGGRPGLVIPINMLDDFDNRWAYAFAFGAVTNTVVIIFTDGPNLDFDGRLVAKVLVGILLILEICLNLYPFFACLTTDNKLAGNFIGFLYASLWFGVLLYFTLECLNPVPEVLPYVNLVVQFPTLLCMAFLVIWFFVFLIITIHKMVKNRKKKMKPEPPVVAVKWQTDYVRYLVNKKPDNEDDEEELTCLQKFKRWIANNLYDYPVPFKYTARVFCSLFVVFMCTYQLGVVYFWWNAQIIGWLEITMEQLFEVFDIPESSEVDNIKVSTRILSVGWQAVTGVTLVLFSLDALAVFVMYRSHMLMLFRGDRSFLPRDMNTDSAELMRCCMLYSGFQVGYMIWGFFVMNFVMWLLTLIAGFIIVLPAMNGYYDILINIAEVTVIPIILDMILRQIQQVLARRFFLQPKVNSDDDQKPLALNNRKLFHIANYFFFFSNIATGLFSCLLRILKTLAFGLLYLGRLDRCVLMGGRESFDIGHNAYLGMIHIEAAHNNPILRVFCQHLYDSVTMDTAGSHSDTGSHHSDDPEEGKLEEPHEKIKLKEGIEEVDSGSRRSSLTLSSARSRRRWHLLYTLLHNPTLIPQRKVNVLEKLDAAKRKIDINLVIAKKERYDRLQQELEELEKEIKGDRKMLEDDMQSCKAFTICNNIIKMDIGVQPESLSQNGTTRKGSGSERDTTMVDLSSENLVENLVKRDSKISTRSEDTKTKSEEKTDENIGTPVTSQILVAEVEKSEDKDTSEEPLICLDDEGPKVSKDNDGHLNINDVADDIAFADGSKETVNSSTESMKL